MDIIDAILFLDANRTKKPSEVGMAGIIYTATSKDGLVYVGKTSQAMNPRITIHMTSAKRNKHPMAREIVSNGIGSFTFKVIDCREDEYELKLLERDYIEKYNSMHPNGLNSKTGGINEKCSEELVKRLSTSHIGYKQTEEHIENLRKAITGLKRSQEIKTKMSIANPQRVQIMCVETGVVYRSIQFAGRETGIAYQNIWKCCAGRRDLAGGFHWKYVDTMQKHV